MVQSVKLFSDLKLATDNLSFYNLLVKYLMEAVVVS